MRNDSVYDQMKYQQMRHQNETLIGLVKDLLDDRQCAYDPSGNCWAHAWTQTSFSCPHGRAKTFLKELER